MNTTEKGNLTELKIAVRLLELGKAVFRSFGDGCRYDLLVDDNGKFIRIQCKTGRIRKGAIRFNAYSLCSWKDEVRRYDGQIDAFGIYCPENDRCYLVPVEAIRCFKPMLRLDATRNGQAKGVRLASDFELCSSGAITSA